jgi:hypothetical protein
MCLGLYGLQGCSDKHDFVRRLVRVFANILHRCADIEEDTTSVDRAPVDILTLSNSMLGMQSMSNAHHEEVRHLLSAVARHLALCSIPSGLEHISHIGTVTGNFLYGLQAMQLKSIGLKSDDFLQELSVLLDLIHTQLVLPFSVHFQVNSIQRSLYGIVAMLSNGTSYGIAAMLCNGTSSAPLSAFSVGNMLEVLLLQVSFILRLGHPIKHHTDTNCDLYREIVPLFQALSLLKHALQKNLEHSAQLNKKEEDTVTANIATLDLLLLHLQPLIPRSDGLYTTGSKTENIF